MNNLKLKALKYNEEDDRFILEKELISTFYKTELFNLAEMDDETLKSFIACDRRNQIETILSLFDDVLEDVLTIKAELNKEVK